MKRISVSIFNLLVFLSITATLGGQDTTKVYGLRLGADLARAGYYFAIPSEKGLEFSADFEVYPNVFATLEAGGMSCFIDRDLYNVGISGSYFRIGADYNFLKLKEKPNNHMIYAGLRYGFSSYTQTWDSAFVPSAVWGDRLLAFELPQNAHWIGLTGGLKVEVLKNFYLGWSVQYNFILSKFSDTIDPFLIPGYGHLTEKKPVSIHYSLFYTIPFFRK